MRSIRHGRKKLALLRLSGLGVFRVIVHREFPINTPSACGASPNTPRAHTPEAR